MITWKSCSGYAWGDSPKEGDHGSDKGDDGHVDGGDDGAHQNVVGGPHSLIGAQHVVVGKAESGPAVNLVATHNLQNGEDVQSCEHAARLLEGEHHKGGHVKAECPVACKPPRPSKLQVLVARTAELIMSMAFAAAQACMHEECLCQRS